MSPKQKHVEVTINPDGTVSVEGHGFHGAECQRAMTEIVTALGGGEVTHLKRKPEFYGAVSLQQQQKIGG